ncbi:hypothetical protein BC834DRAFT_320718 [Gloeopeniophorella convolvens]|nr:hypothetical protein BC834DRAFT_320718 [Gloeopeniophorella convolvens]
MERLGRESTRPIWLIARACASFFWVVGASATATYTFPRRPICRDGGYIFRGVCNRASSRDSHFFSASQNDSHTAGANAPPLAPFHAFNTATLPYAVDGVLTLLGRTTLETDLGSIDWLLDYALAGRSLGRELSRRGVGTLLGVGER